jgi:hypothetical protein
LWERGVGCSSKAVAVTATNFPVICSIGYSQTTHCHSTSPPAMNLNTLARVTAHNLTALREGLKIVRKVVASNPYPAGFTTAELFKLVSKESPPADFKALKLPHRPVSAKNAIKRVPVPSPPRPNHPIKSMTCVRIVAIFLLC